MFSLICVWINGWVNNREAGDLRRNRGHYDVIIMNSLLSVSDGIISSFHSVNTPHSSQVRATYGVFFSVFMIWNYFSTFFLSIIWDSLQLDLIKTYVRYCSIISSFMQLPYVFTYNWYTSLNKNLCDDHTSPQLNIWMPFTKRRNIKPCMYTGMTRNME